VPLDTSLLVFFNSLPSAILIQWLCGSTVAPKVWS